MFKTASGSKKDRNGKYSSNDFPQTLHRSSTGTRPIVSGEDARAPRLTSDGSSGSRLHDRMIIDQLENDYPVACKSLRNSTRLALDPMGHRVTEAGDSAQAQELLGHHLGIRSLHHGPLPDSLGRTPRKRAVRSCPRSLVPRTALELGGAVALDELEAEHIRRILGKVATMEWRFGFAPPLGIARLHPHTACAFCRTWACHRRSAW